MLFKDWLRSRKQTQCRSKKVEKDSVASISRKVLDVVDVAIAPAEAEAATLHLNWKLILLLTFLTTCLQPKTLQWKMESKIIHNTYSKQLPNTLKYSPLLHHWLHQRPSKQKSSCTSIRPSHSTKTTNQCQVHPNTSEAFRTPLFLIQLASKKLTKLPSNCKKSLSMSQRTIRQSN